MGFNIVNCRQKSKGEILLSILNVAIYAAKINMISCNSCICYGNVKIILKITIIKVNYIIFLFVLIIMVVNYDIFNARENEFIILSFKQLVVNSDIFV